MGIQHEQAFEQEICDALEERGWVVSQSDKQPGAEYDKQRALIPGDVLEWLQQTQPEQLAKVVKADASELEQSKQREQLLDRLVKTLNLPLESGGGTLHVLRKGFKHLNATFRMATFKPATGINAQTLAEHEAVRLRAVRQVYYSAKGKQSIDLVLFVNGLPVATLELKTDNVQALDDAVKQYRVDRSPKGEPLLGFANRCLVHFAVSNDRVAMTTRLDGAATRFLPFDRGDDGASGNPPVAGKAASSYLWERVLERGAWLHILGRLLHLEHTQHTDPITGAIEKRTTLLFPRFHQWELVTSLLATVREEGPGQRYLVQHSAGSGKTNSIAWLAHGLATLHDTADAKVFDSVIVVTDRTVLDDQLQQAIRGIEGVDGTVATINADAVRKAGDDVQAKSALLAQELASGRLIIVVTLQTFPFALEAIRQTPGLASKRFAIIADEAHSSQTGAAAKELRKVLTADEQAALDDGGELDVEAMLAHEMTNRAASANLSFFAFTATPKAKTMELFGRPATPGGLPAPFHVYSMQQAIEEGYILDVLRNYTTYSTAFRVAEAAKRRLQIVEEVDEAEATKGLMRWVSLHPTNIAQKVQIIVEHYRANVAHLLDGHAKAMVVTASREAAVRYKEAIDRYIASKGYRMGTLVAFSGSLTEEQTAGVAFAHAEPPYTEANLNTKMRGRALPVALGSDDFQILIVANKYQTGFDQPLLCAMYVDKRLAGVAAVQTLSRLNRTYAGGGKDTTYILDFVNDPDEILASFQPYYRDASLERESDPNVVHDLQSKLDAALIYSHADFEAFASAFLGAGGSGPKHGAHTAPLKVAADRFNQRYSAAVADEDRAELEVLDGFRKDVGSFVRLYDFLSQILDYGDTDLEKRSLYLRLLLPRLTGRVSPDAIDLSAVELTHIKQTRSGEHALVLGPDANPLRASTSGETGTARDPRLARLAEILERINDLFADHDFAESSIESWVQGVVTVLDDHADLHMQAAANSAAQFVDSPDLDDAVVGAMLASNETNGRIVDTVFDQPGLRREVVRFIGELFYENALQRRTASSAVIAEDHGTLEFRSDRPA
ncbi:MULTISPECIES: type I restriction endonuclease subunit R [unclassified Agrococcus]|uniref:type I restriction endonuclease subunit R n=1 Tax=unclassified Agrococcus TaxID=2615065 RepID=UPI00362269A2